MHRYSTRRTAAIAVAVSCALSAMAGAAKADRVVLFGGGTIEGKVERAGDKVVIEIASGVVTLPADAVVRVERSESPLDRFEARYRALGPKDVAARLDLADFCRRHDLLARERELLQQIIRIDPDHEAARGRLGFVRVDGQWLTRETMRQRGMVRHEGRWVNEKELLELERLELEKEAAAERRRAAEAELEARKTELEARRVELSNARKVTAPAEIVGGGTAFTSYVPGFALASRRVTKRAAEPCDERHRCRRKAPSRKTGRIGFSPDSFESSLSVVKVPYGAP